MGQVNFTSVANAFHTYFVPRMERIGYEEQPTVAWLPKDENFPGLASAGLQFDVAYESPPGMSADFATALANAGTGSYATFTVNRRRYYNVVNLDNESMEGSASMDGAYVDLKKEEVTTAVKATTEKMGNMVFRNHGGAIAQCNGITGQTITLLSAADRVNFRRGQFCQFATTDGTSGAVRTGQSQVLKVNRSGSTSTVTFATTLLTDVPGVTATAAADYIFNAGDFGSAVNGFDSYIPLTAPTTGDSVFVFDRSVDTRLSGMRFDGSTYNIADAIMKGLGEFRTEGGSGAIDTVILSYDRFTDLSLDLGAKAVRDPSGTGEAGYDKIRLHAGGKAVSVMGDHNCQKDVAWCLTKRTWLWKSLGKTPRFFTQATGNNQFIVDPTADGVQIRAGWRGNLLCLAPGLNGRIKLPTT